MLDLFVVTVTYVYALNKFFHLGVRTYRPKGFEVQCVQDKPGPTTAMFDF